MSPVAVCEVTENADGDAENEATYTFTVKLKDDGTNVKQSFRYTFTPKRNDQAYEVIEAKVTNAASPNLVNANDLSGVIVEAGLKSLIFRCESEL